MQPVLAARPFIKLDDDLEVGKSIVSFPISQMHWVDARSRFSRGGSCNEDKKINSEGRDDNNNNNNNNMLS